ncbi:energy-coupling factor transporter ATPase [Oceanirhabdus seepicola]|uniref:Energy-coupling factor transporter ATP-binding protein EcfA2 n=1 Tax=Oceanirhabdus seepicola TaxID=2828781 RepID=A0A9J6NZZ9_9CLOT|nr:energy-coupling factor transporter ATPase [Oceanirhabdus seepicola]MCM1989676.1 energy-coupling factor transporter ATPase [Oceanirhabdus seepicola]
MSIIIKNLTHIYMKGTPFERKALDRVDIEIDSGEFVAIIGHTGSGKSTLIQHINGLLKPDSGTILINGVNIADKSVKLSNIRKKVGLVFQYPEYQLFEETIEKDIAFGPGKLKISQDEIKNRVIKAMESVGLDYEFYKDKSPFELSGGQKRRVAIAGVIAMEPEVLILDEPTAGLDPKGRDEILKQIKHFQEIYNMTIILVSHSMDDVSRIADKIFVMEKGKIVMNGTPREVFSNVNKIEKVGLSAPQIAYLMKKLKEKGVEIDENIYTVKEAAIEIQKLYSKKLMGGS